jgi:putative transposase
MRSYPSDLADVEWALVEPLLIRSGKPGPKHGDLRRVVNALLYQVHTGCQWRYLPSEYGPWTRAWSQFRRWSVNGTWSRVLAGLHAHARTVLGRAEPTSSLITIDTHLARGSSHGGATFHDRGGPFGRTKGAKRAIAVDVTGLPIAATVFPASAHENVTVAGLLDLLHAQGQAGRLQVVLVDQGTTENAAARMSAGWNVEVRRVGWPDKQPQFRPIAHAWRVEVAHGLLGRARRLAKSFENTLASASAWLQVACVATILAALRRPLGAVPVTIAVDG